MNKIKSEPENLSASLMNSMANEYTSGALMELGEVVLDTATDSFVKSDAAASIPVVNIFVALAKGVLNFRDKMYVNKILYFLSETSKASDEDRIRYTKKLDSNPKEVNKVGRTILDILDKVTSAEKAQMVGKVCRAYMHEENITSEDVLTLSEMIEKAYLSDLIALSRKDENTGERWNDANLESVGIKKPMRVEDINNALKVAVENLQKRIPTIAAEPIKDKDFNVVESGFTERGVLLTRILRDY